MQASLPNSDAGLLLGLWQLSLIFAAAGLSTALILIGRRMYEERLDRNNGRRRQKFENILWAVLNGTISIKAIKPPKLRGNDALILCDLALDLLRPLRGEEAARIVQLLQSWNIQEAIEKILKFGSRGKRIRMLTLLGRFNDKRSLATLKKWIKSKDLYIQLGALRSLAVRNAVDALPEIVSQLANTKRHNILMLADVLERFGPQAAVNLLPLARDASEIEVRLAAITALGSIGTLGSVPDLIKLAKDPNAEVRAQSIASLSRIGDQRAEDAIMTALTDHNSAVRLQAAQAAGTLQLQNTTPSLIKLLTDGFWWVRYRAAEALYLMGGAGPVLLRSASTEETERGFIAAQVLAEMESA